MKCVLRLMYLAIGILLILFIYNFGKTVFYLNAKLRKENQLYDFYRFDNDARQTTQVIPNIVHYIVFGRSTISFVTFLSVVSVIKVHRPDEIWIHCDIPDFEGNYWLLLKELAQMESIRMKIKYLPRPTHVYGQPLSSIFHSTDVARILVLMKFGGIYLDTDILVLKSLNEFLNYEMVIGWPEDDYIGTQVLIGHKDARFLELWLDGYRRYQPREWYYNAGQYPTNQVLKKHRGIAYRVKNSFGVQNLLDRLYKETLWPGWKHLHTVHLLARHPPFPEHINEYSVRSYNRTFGEISRWILFKISPELDLSTRIPHWSL